MSDVNKESILNRLNLTNEQGTALIEAAINSPMEALALLQTFNVDQAVLQELLSEFMTNPGIFIELAESLGMPNEKIEQFKAKFSL
jgi:hypothetical protein